MPRQAYWITVPLGSGMRTFAGPRVANADMKADSNRSSHGDIFDELLAWWLGRPAIIPPRRVPASFSGMPPKILHHAGATAGACIFDYLDTVTGFSCRRVA